MNRWKTKQLVSENQVVTFKADKTTAAPEVDQLLVDLGNHAQSIPFIAIYPAGSGTPIVISGPITQNQILEALGTAGPSKAGDRMAQVRD